MCSSCQLKDYCPGEKGELGLPGASPMAQTLACPPLAALSSVPSPLVKPAEVSSLPSPPGIRNLHAARGAGEFWGLRLGCRFEGECNDWRWVALTGCPFWPAVRHSVPMCPGVCNSVVSYATHSEWSYKPLPKHSCCSGRAPCTDGLNMGVCRISSGYILQNSVCP
jgi:hypothetical protein